MISKFMWLAALPLALCSVSALAEYDSETGAEKACVSYQRADYSYSQRYKVRGLIVDGNELRDFARSNGYEYSSYQGYKHYFVIPWQEGGYTALEIPYGSDLPSYETTVRDQQRKQWRLKDGWSYCY